MNPYIKFMLKLNEQPTFPVWAKSKPNELFRKSNRILGENGEVIWDISAENPEISDHIEMSGFLASAIISYGKDKNNRLRIFTHLIVPNERIKPNVTQSSFSYNFTESSAVIKIDGKKAAETPIKVITKGTLKIISEADKVNITREFFPCADHPALIEKITVRNVSGADLSVKIKENEDTRIFPSEICAFAPIKASGRLSSGSQFTEKFKSDKIEKTLPDGSSISVYCVYFATSKIEENLSFDIEEQIRKRNTFIDDMFSSLVLHTPSKELNAQFSHCVLRGSESIFKTKNGLMHAPGGGNYYAALWTNDQCEYANPFFPFSGYEKGIEQSINCYSLYENYMDKSDTPFKEKTALVTSIISCGDGYWNGAKDRGDSEMYAYGLSRFLLCMGDKKLMERFFDNLCWCIDFAFSRKNESGVIKSDSDELENRFESSDANLFTSCLTYDALINCSLIAEILGKNDKATEWKEEYVKLRDCIEAYFGANVEGFDTYQYYKGNEDLRAWICMPLSVEIFDRKDETVKALFSDKLYENGMLKTSSKHSTTWDRSLLFALRGTFLAGKAEEGTKAILDYCNNRLLGSHSPYAFEAYPEGNRAHLAAESLLFARSVTEGLFGLRAVGYRKLRIKPCLSEKLNSISLSGLKLFGLNFDVSCNGNSICIMIDGKEYIAIDREVIFDFETMKFE